MAENAQHDHARHIAGIRKDYRLAVLDEAAAGNDPLLFFRRWFAEAEAAGIDEVNAMALATADGEGRPHARIVLLKGLDARGFAFYSNYESAKGHQIDQRPHAALVFFWKELERQVRVEGRIARVPSEESDAYFASRPLGSRLGAWASPQSSAIADRAILEERVGHFTELYKDGNIPRPSYWGGYLVVPFSMEFWQGRSNRLHDRIVFRREHEDMPWDKLRLAP